MDKGVAPLPEDLRLDMLSTLKTLSSRGLAPSAWKEIEHLLASLDQGLREGAPREVGRAVVGIDERLFPPSTTRSMHIPPQPVDRPPSPSAQPPPQQVLELVNRIIHEYASPPADHSR
jgi:hypothetical protein